jgi:gliding motility-associated-like protein
LSYWNDAGATSSLATPAAVATSGTYYIQASNAGCTDINPVVVTVNATPNLVITDPAAVCTPSTVNITAAAVTAGSTNVGTLSYWTDAGATSALASPSAVATSGTYYIQATNAGCTDINPVVVTINATPNLVITNPAAVCSPSTVDLTAAAVTAGSTNVGVLSYWNDAGATSSLATPAAVATSGTYYIQAANSGCIDINAVVVTVNPLPTFTLAGTDPSACNMSDGSITISGLTISTAYSVSYDDDAAGVGPLALNSDASGNILISGLNAGTYDNFSVTLVSTGCAGTSVTVIILNNPGAPILDPVADDVVCDTYVLPAITGTGLTGNEAYWTATGGTGTQLAVGSNVNSTQLIYIYDINGLCSDEETFTIVVNNTPTITNPGNQTVCASYTLPAIAGTNLSGTESYFNNSQALGGTIISGAVTSTQTVWIYDANGTCSDEESFVVTVNQLPTVTSVTGGGTYCMGDLVNDIMVATTGSANWTVDYTFDGIGQTATGSASPISLGNAAGVYVVTNITDANCTNTASGTQTITINTIPIAPLAGTDANYCSTDVFSDLTAIGGSGILTWYSDPALTNSIGTGSTLSPINTIGVTSYYVTETNGTCEGPSSIVTITIIDCDTVQVTDIVIPTAFTPNGDLSNDVWEIIDIDSKYSNNIVYVYNRWGALIYESKKGAYSSDPWDGTFNNELLPVASYYYIIYTEGDRSGEILNGIVTIVTSK